MSRKQLIILASLGGFIVLVVVFGFISGNEMMPGVLVPSGGDEAPGTIEGALNGGQIFTSEVPESAVLTTPTQTIEIVNQPGERPGVKFRIFQIVANRNGYTPSSLTVNRGDTVEINLNADGESYDMFSSSAGFYASAAPNAPGKVSFKAGTGGTFLFECRDHCPPGDKIKGTLIVISE
ncbi:MAG: cupredoxin domain-containing protein [Candidatus Brennerbacteria bacterium]